jgi:hypothetical protein
MNPLALGCFRQETDLFRNPLYQSDIEEGKWDTVEPSTTNFETGTLSFLVPECQEYIDLSETDLYLKCKIVKINKTENTKTKITEANMIAPVNNMLNSIFSQVTVTLNDTPVDNSNGSYAYRAYIEDLLNYGTQAKKSHLQTQLFEKDTANHFDTIPKAVVIKAEGKADVPGVEGDQNKAFTARRKKFTDSDQVELWGKIHANIFNTEKYLIPKVKMFINLVRASNDFALLGSETDFEITIQKARLYVRKVKLSVNLQNQHNKMLNSQPATYPIRRVVLNTRHIINQTKETILSQLSVGQMPRRIIFGLVDHQAFSGTLKLNPFNFQNFNLNEISVSVGGTMLPYGKPIRLEYAKNNYVLGYMSLFKGLNKTIYERGHDISYDEYQNGFTLYAFNLTPDLCDGDDFTTFVTGSLDISLKFEKPLDKTVEAIIYLEYDNIVQIDQLRRVSKDYNN